MLAADTAGALQHLLDSRLMALPAVGSLNIHTLKNGTLHIDLEGVPEAPDLVDA